MIVYDDDCALLLFLSDCIDVKFPTSSHASLLLLALFYLTYYSLSWDYNILHDIDLDYYEKERPPRRVQNEMILPRNMREDLLKFECNISRKDITDSIRQNVKVKNQRRTTVNNLDKLTIFEEAMESASRKLKRFVKREKSVHKQVKDMEEQIDLSNRRRSKLIYLEQNMSQEGEDTSPTDKVSLVLSGSADGSESS
jgi:hypothetical protein